MRYTQTKNTLTIIWPYSVLEYILGTKSLFKVPPAIQELFMILLINYQATTYLLVRANRISVVFDFDGVVSHFTDC